MARKFYTSYHALIGNYNANQNVVRFSYVGGTWVESELINAPPSGGNLLSMSIGAATIGTARCLKTAYQNNAVVPINCNAGVWSVGSAVSLAAAGSPSSISISLDGNHALTACDNAANVNAVKYNMGTGLWQSNGFVGLPESNLTNVAITPDGLRGICVPKTSSHAYPLTRNPITNVWSAGSAINLGSGGTRYFCCSISPDGNVCLIGSNTASNSDALIWDGYSTWNRVSIGFKFAASRWMSDNRTILAVSGNDGDSAVYIISYSPSTQSFSLIQTINLALGTIWGIAIPELGRQDIAVVTSFDQNKLIPLTFSSGSWSAGTAVTSVNFFQPISAVIMPVI